jgi:filamentous hemagglutinin
MEKYAAAQGSLAMKMQKEEATPDEISEALARQARGYLPEGQDPARGLILAWGNFVGIPLDLVMANEQMTPQKAAEIVSSGVPTSEGKVMQYIAAKAFLEVIKFDNSTHNAASYSGLKMDLKTTQSANEAVESLWNTGKLPDYYVTKQQAAEKGWKPGKVINNTTPGGQIGGDIFENSTNILPSSQGRVWREADIGLGNTISRSKQPGTRLLYSNDGLLYITTDHYETATPIGRWK